LLAGLHIQQKHSIQSHSTAAVSQVTVQKEGLVHMVELLDMVDLAAKDHTVEAVAMVEMQMAEKVEMVDVVETQKHYVL
jgi:hypothetical protein